MIRFRPPHWLPACWLRFGWVGLAPTGRLLRVSVYIPDLLSDRHCLVASTNAGKSPDEKGTEQDPGGIRSGDGGVEVAEGPEVHLIAGGLCRL